MSTKSTTSTSVTTTITPQMYPQFVNKPTIPLLSTKIKTSGPMTSGNIKNFIDTPLITSGSFYFTLSSNINPLFLDIPKASFDEPALKNNQIVDSLFVSITESTPLNLIVDKYKCLNYLTQQIDYFGMYLEKLIKINKLPLQIANNTFSQYTFIKRALNFFLKETISKLENNGINLETLNKSYTIHPDLVKYLNFCQSNISSGICDTVITGKTCKAMLSNDGNLVVYDNNNTPIWASNTTGSGIEPYNAVVKDDGNLVIIDSTNEIIWSTNTTGNGKAPYRAILQDDCNFVLYDANNKSLWNTNTRRIPALPQRTRTTFTPK